MKSIFMVSIWSRPSLRGFIFRRTFSNKTTPPRPTDTVSTRKIWAEHFRIDKKLLGKQFDIFRSGAKKDSNITDKVGGTNKTGSQHQSDSRQRKEQAKVAREHARMQLKAHVHYATQLVKNSNSLLIILKSVPSTDVAFAVHSLSGTMELLIHYYESTSKCDSYFCTKWFRTSKESSLFRDWQVLRASTLQAAMELKELLPRSWVLPNDGKIPLESVPELMVQSFLDAVTNRTSSGSKRVSIEEVQETLRKAFPNLRTIPATPSTTILSFANERGYHIGGNETHWDVIGGFEPDSFSIHNMYRKVRLQALKKTKSGLGKQHLRVRKDQNGP